MHFVVKLNNKEHGFPNMMDAIGFANQSEANTIYLSNGTRLVRGAFFSWQLVK